MKTFTELMAAQRELTAKMANAEGDARASLQREYDDNKREIELINQKAAYDKNAPATKEKTLVSELREAMNENKRSITVQGYTVGSTTVAGVHGDVVETEIQGILEPLYAKSVLAELGVRFYPGLPQGDIQVPVMGKGTVGWAGEISAASESSNTFTHVTLKPKRLTAYVDISKQLILQDTVGAEAAIKRDIVNALRDKLEATIFGAGAKSDTTPAGIFNGATLADGTTFAKICANEATVENNNVYGNMMYVMNPGAKADLRAMAKSSKNTQLVMEGGLVDGVPAVVTSNVNPTTAGSYVYGDFSNLAVGSWGDIQITIDEFTQAVNGCIRLVVNAYFDASILRSDAFVYGKTR